VGRCWPAGLIDTVVVVSVSRVRCIRGRIADAIFNGNDSSLYLTNPTLGRVEIFQVANTSFVAAGIPTAVHAVGIALWARDTLGNYGDSIVVANAGASSCRSSTSGRPCGASCGARLAGLSDRDLPRADVADP